MNFYDSIPICFWVNKFVIVPYKYTFTLNLTCAGQGLQSIQNVISYNHKLREMVKQRMVKTTKTRLDTFLFITNFITKREIILRTNTFHLEVNRKLIQNR